MEDNYPESTATFDESNLNPSCVACGKVFSDEQGAFQHWRDKDGGEHKGEPDIEFVIDDSDTQDTGHYTNWN